MAASNDDLARLLATELREAVALAHGTAVPPAGLADALAHARALTAELRSHPRRPQWYEAVGPDDDPLVVSRVQGDAYGPIRGALNAVAPPIELWPVERADGTTDVEGRVTMPRRYEGPPKGVHGGWIAALFDDVLGMTQRVTGSSGAVTARLVVRYRRLTPVGRELRFAGWVEAVHGRRRMLAATCHVDGELVSEAEALFVAVDLAELAARDTGGPATAT